MYLPCPCLRIAVDIADLDYIDGHEDIEHQVVRVYRKALGEQHLLVSACPLGPPCLPGLFLGVCVCCWGGCLGVCLRVCVGVCPCVRVWECAPFRLSPARRFCGGEVGGAGRGC